MTSRENVASFTRFEPMLQEVVYSNNLCTDYHLEKSIQDGVFSVSLVELWHSMYVFVTRDTSASHMKPFDE